MKPPLSDWKAARASSSMAVESPGAATLRATLVDDLGRLPPGVGVEGRRGVLAGGRVLEHLAARRRHQRVDPHHVALVAGAGDVDGGAGLLGGVDDLVPRHRLAGGIEARPARRPTCGTRAAGCWPRTGRRRARRSRSTSSTGAVEHVVGQRRGLVVGERAEEVRLGELGHEHRVEAHEVDRAVVGRQPPHELLALAVGVAGGAPRSRCGRRRRPPRCTSPPASPGRRCRGSCTRSASVCRCRRPRHRRGRRRPGAPAPRGARHGGELAFAARRVVRRLARSPPSGTSLSGKPYRDQRHVIRESRQNASRSGARRGRSGRPRVTRRAGAASPRPPGDRCRPRRARRGRGPPCARRPARGRGRAAA